MPTDLISPLVMEAELSQLYGSGSYLIITDHICICTEDPSHIKLRHLYTLFCLNVIFQSNLEILLLVERYSRIISYFNGCSNIDKTKTQTAMYILASDFFRKRL